MPSVKVQLTSLTWLYASSWINWRYCLSISQGTMLPYLISHRTGIILFVVATSILFPCFVSHANFMIYCAIGWFFHQHWPLLRHLESSLAINSLVVPAPSFLGSTMWNLDLRSLVLVSSKLRWYSSPITTNVLYHETSSPTCIHRICYYVLQPVGRGRCRYDSSEISSKRWCL